MIYYYLYAVPGLVSNISLEHYQTACIAKWNVSNKVIFIKIIFIIISYHHHQSIFLCSTTLLLTMSVIMAVS